MLVYAARADTVDHDGYRAWLEAALASEEPFGVAPLVLSGFIRVVTHPRVFNVPSEIETALTFVEAVRDAPNTVLIEPGPRHWDIFVRLCRSANAKGNRVADAYLAALAIESGCEWITTDRDFSRFHGLRWRHPLAPDS